MAIYDHGNVVPIGIRRQQPGRVTVLALGGPWHGQRITLPETWSTVVAPVPQAPEYVRPRAVPPVRSFPWPASVPTPRETIPTPDLNTVTYVLVKMGWSSSRRVLKLLFPEKWTQAEAEHALVDWIESGGA